MFCAIRRGRRWEDKAVRRYILRAGSSSLDDLVMEELDEPRPGPREILIRVRACSLNYRDQAVVTGNYFGGKVPANQVPLSDGAGEVVETGAEVSQFRPGDRVSSAFFLNWLTSAPVSTTSPAPSESGTWFAGTLPPK